MNKIHIASALGKCDEVVSLLRHLPYIGDVNSNRADATPHCIFADWQQFASYIGSGNLSGEDVRVITESCELYEVLPPHVVSLTAGDRDNPVFLLDTELGIVLWYECPEFIWWTPSREPVWDHPWDYAGDDMEQAAWRGESKAWAIADFFELLKDQFRALEFVPLSRRVVTSDSICGVIREGMVPTVKAIFRQYGWPDLERYRKEECLDAVYRTLKEKYPGQERE